MYANMDLIVTLNDFGFSGYLGVCRERCREIYARQQRDTS
jgi:hypothetical protein